MTPRFCLTKKNNTLPSYEISYVTRCSSIETIHSDAMALAVHVAAGAYSIARAVDVAPVVLPLRLALVEAITGLGADASSPGTIILVAVGGHEASGEGSEDLMIC
jgi:hypothetical protein